MKMDSAIARHAISSEIDLEMGEDSYLPIANDRGLFVVVEVVVLYSGVKFLCDDYAKGISVE